MNASKFLTFLFENNLAFPYSKINLLGFDFGCEIITNTLKSLHNKSLSNIFHDIAFIAGTPAIDDINFLKESVYVSI